LSNYDANQRGTINLKQESNIFGCKTNKASEEEGKPEHLKTSSLLLMLLLLLV
jgi:hypothetical protein